MNWTQADAAPELDGRTGRTQGWARTDADPFLSCVFPSLIEALGLKMIRVELNPVPNLMVSKDNDRISFSYNKDCPIPSQSENKDLRRLCKTDPIISDKGDYKAEKEM
jgi:hypothetical protein